MQKPSTSWTTQLLVAVFCGAVFLAGLPIVLGWLLRLVPVLLCLALLVGIIGMAVGGFRRRW